MEQDRERRELAMVLKYARFRGNDVLEVGCGDGRVSGDIARHAKSLVAIDPDAERLEKARRAHPGLDFRIGSGESLEFPDGSFDTVAFTFSLHHQDPAKALEEARRVLRPGGQALIVEPSVEGEMHRFFRAFRDEDADIAEALRAIGRSGLRLDSSETFTVEWVFEDAEDLYAYFFEHNGTARTAEMVCRLDSLLGGKKGNRPIPLSETVTIFSLTKVE